MSRFMSKNHAQLTAYTPGEQPTNKNKKYIKLNTNESPFPPSEKVVRAAEAESRVLNLYSDPECTALVKTAAEYFGNGKLSPDNFLFTNGSDEILNFAFLAYGDDNNPFVFPEISYGFYRVYADLYHIPYNAIPLKPDFSIDPNDYMNLDANIVIANPNAPTGLYLTLGEIERIVSSNRNHVVVIDEAYIDFGGESCLPLIQKYDNLLVTRTYSKSYSLAGARLGFGMACESLISDLKTIKYSTNPYNINRMTMAAGIAALEDGEYYMNCCRIIVENREYTKMRLKELGFTLTESMTNFIFATHPKISGRELYLRLKDAGILIRHFDTQAIADYNRITIGTKDEMDSLIGEIQNILGK